MKRETLIFFLGVLLALLPFFGIPNVWKQGTAVAFGLILMLLGYQLRRSAYLRSIESRTGERRTDVYVEQIPPETNSQMELVDHPAVPRAVAEEIALAPKARRVRIKL